MGWSFTPWLRRVTRPFLLPIARGLGKLGLSPNAITLLGLLAYGATGLVLALGYRFSAGVMLVILGPLDALDGLLARDTGQVSKFGAFLDSNVDRFAEFFLFLGLLYYLFHFRHAGFKEAALVLTSMTGSLLVSYARARAEALGFTCTVGLMTRVERLILFGVALLFDLIVPVLWVLAILTPITAIHRIIHVYGEYKKQNTLKD